MNLDAFKSWKTFFSSITFCRPKHSLDNQSPQQTPKRNTMKIEKLRIFETAKQDFESLELSANKRPLHRMQLLHVVQSFVATLLLCLYLVYETNDTREYLESIVMSTAGFLGFAVYCLTIFKMTSIYDCTDRYETAINESRRYHCWQLLTLQRQPRKIAIYASLFL